MLDGHLVLRGIDLDIAPGLTTLRGPNGAGKTTLLRAIAGVVPLARGTREVRGDLLLIGHRAQLLRGLSARENLAFFARFRGKDARSAGDSVSAALARWDLAADADRSVDALSAGQRRRASLARLESEPCDVVLLDEPFADLDDRASALLVARLAELRSEGRAVAIATHGRADLATDRTVRLDAGALS